jgi:hypothetical protein
MRDPPVAAERDWRAPDDPRGAPASARKPVELDDPMGVTNGDGMPHELRADASRVIVGLGEPLTEPRIGVNLAPVWDVSIKCTFDLTVLRSLLEMPQVLILSPQLVKLGAEGFNGRALGHIDQLTAVIFLVLRSHQLRSHGCVLT